MNIYVVSGKGVGKTQLSAFDAALKDAGVHNYNLICLSSIIPPHSNIIVSERYNTPEDEYGHKLYVVRATISSGKVGESLAAGVGWYRPEGDGRGLFVEHETCGEGEETVKKKVEQDIKNSLMDLCGFRGIEFDESRLHMLVTSATVTEQPASALVIAVYQAKGWD